MNRAVLLINPNRMRPPIAPIGLEYVAAGLEQHGYLPAICDLTFAEDWRAELRSALEGIQPAAIGISIRNLDDAYFASQDFILEATNVIIGEVLAQTQAPVVLGGVGFSIAPHEVLAFTGAPYGIAGAGESAFPALLDALAANACPASIEGVVQRGMTASVRAATAGLATAPSRRRVNNPRYFAEGGQAGLETKRGCDGCCIYCVEPYAKGTCPHLRTPESIVAECRDLLDQGIQVIHLCDSEFNLPYAHAMAVCEAIAQAGLGQRLRWYTYASVEGFDVALARAMSRAGCAGINFGVDHVCPDLLRTLGRTHDENDIRRAAHACREAGLAVMFDLLLGGPGETRTTLARAIETMRAINPDCVGLSCGMRVYPHTGIAEHIRAQGPLEANPHLHGQRTGNDHLLRPIFYVDAAIGAGIHRTVSELIGGDKRFFHADPSEIEGNYNYNDNSVLANAIRDGARGAYWDILRKIA